MDLYGDFPVVSIPTLGKDVLSKIKLEHDDSICSDYSLSDIEDALDPNDSFEAKETNEINRTFQKIPAPIVVDSGLSSSTDTRLSSSSSSVSTQNSPFSTIERSNSSPAVQQQDEIEDQSSPSSQKHTDVRTAIAAFENKPNRSSPKTEATDDDERDTLSSMHNFNATFTPTDDNPSRSTTTNLSRQRSLSQSHATSTRSYDSNSDKNNNNNELAMRTLPRLAPGAQMSQPQWKRYNKAMETYRKCKSGDKNGSDDVKSDKKHRSMSSGEPLYQNVTSIFTAPKTIDTGRRPNSMVKPVEKTAPSYAPICPPDQDRNSLSPLTTLTLDYKTILRRSHINDRDPNLLHHIQGDAYLDDEDPDLVTDIDSFLQIPEKRHPRDNPPPTARRTSTGDGNEYSSPSNNQEPDKILWSGLKLLGDSKKSDQQQQSPKLDAQKNSLLTKIQKISLRKTGILVSDDNERTSNLRKNAIISRRNNAKSQQFEKSIYLDPSSHNGVGITSSSSFRQFHTLATPGRLARMRRESKKSSTLSNSPNKNKKPLKSRSQYSFARKFLRVPTILKNNSEFLERIKPRRREESLSSSSDDDVPITLTRRYSKSSTDLFTYHQDSEFDRTKDMNKCANNNNFTTSWSAQSSPRKKSRRKRRNKPSKLVIDMNKGSCEIVNTTENAQSESRTESDKATETSNYLNVELFKPSLTPKKINFGLSLPVEDDSSSDRNSFRFTTCQFTDFVSSDATTLDLNIEDYFSFLGAKPNETTTPDCETDGKNISVQQAICNIEIAVEEASNVDCEHNNPVPKSPRRTNPVKRRRRKNKRRSGVPSYVPDYIKPALSSKSKQSSACYQLNLPEIGRKPSDPEVIDSMAAFISNPSVQECIRKSGNGNAKTWSGRIKEKRGSNVRSKFGSLSFAKLLKANKLKLSVGRYLMFLNIKKLVQPIAAD